MLYTISLLSSACYTHVSQLFKHDEGCDSLLYSSFFAYTLYRLCYYNNFTTYCTNRNTLTNIAKMYGPNVFQCFKSHKHTPCDRFIVCLLGSTSQYISHLQAIRGRNQQPDKIIAGSVLCVIGNIVTHYECYRLQWKCDVTR